MKFTSACQSAARLTLLGLLTINVPAFLCAVPQRSIKDTAEQEIEHARKDISRNDFIEAKKAVKRALKLKDNSSEACLLMAVLQRIEGKKDEALKYVRKAIAFNPGYVEAHTFYARLLFEGGLTGQARTQLAITLAMTPKDPSAYVLSGEVYLQEKKYKEGVESFETAISIAPADDAGTVAIQARVDGIKRYIEFKSREPDDASITKPILKNLPWPSYTEEARRAHTQGLVKLGVLVSETGEVIDHIVLSGLPNGLTSQAVRAARTARFSPALRAGKPVQYWQPIDVEFNLK